MNLLPEEPSFAPWNVASLDDFVTALSTSKSTESTPKIIAIDGRSAGGKTSLAARVHQLIPGSVVVHTDDIPTSASWRGSEAQKTILSDPIPPDASFFDWTDRVIENLFKPFLASQSIRYRPESWDDWNRGEGAIEIPVGCPALILEGVGAGKRELDAFVHKSVWIQSDFDLAKTRGLAREGESEAGWNRFEGQEIPFLADQKSWERADFVVCSTPETQHSADEIAVSSQTPLPTS